MAQIIIFFFISAVSLFCGLLSQNALIHFKINFNYLFVSFNILILLLLSWYLIHRSKHDIAIKLLNLVINLLIVVDLFLALNFLVHAKII